MIDPFVGYCPGAKVGTHDIPFKFVAILNLLHCPVALVTIHFGTSVDLAGHDLTHTALEYWVATGVLAAVEYGATKR